MDSLTPYPLKASSHLLQVLAGRAAGGFPSPAADYYEAPLSLDERLNIRAPHVWLVRVEGDSMQGAGIFDGSLLVVDRSISPMPGHIVLAYVDNQPLVKRLARSPEGWLLESANPNYPSLPPSHYQTVEVFGVVTWDITPHAQ
ncbi:S24 family peptidase [Pseudomonas fulva]|uniref:LexA family protein n=1 Tax=Pseudomonas fulva TaxID=47880 RepID=UPI002DBA3B26|nr:S24 family peptidase [Pseudomonas fulva]MEB8059254.1 S24 family peptidase [Pseudomonas fulva]